MTEKCQNRYFLKPFWWLNLQNDFAFEGNVLRKIEPVKIEENIQRNMERFEYDPKNYEKYAFLHGKLKLSNKTSLNRIE